MFYILIASIAMLLISALSFYRWGVKSLVAVFPLLALALYFLFRTDGGFSLVICAAVIGIFGAFCFRKEKSIQFFMLVSSFVVALVLAGEYAVAVKYGGVDPVKYMNDVMNEAAKNTPQKDAKKPEQIPDIASTVKILKDIIPFNIFCSALILSMLGFGFVKMSLRLILRANETIKGLEFFKLSDWLIFVLIASLAAVVFIKDDLSLYAKLAGLNTLLVITVLYFVQALGIIKFFLLKKGLPVIILPMFFIFLGSLSIMAFAFSVFILSGYGALDVWTDFRKLNGGSKETGNGEENQ